MMELTVVYANAQPKPIRVKLEDEPTVLQAIEKSNILQIHPEIDLKSQRVGVFGKFVKLDSEVQEGDRIEIYQKITRVLDDDEDDDDDDDD